MSHGYIYSTVMLAACLFMTVESNLAYVLGFEDGDIIYNLALLAFAVIICLGLAFLLPHGKKKIK